VKRVYDESYRHHRTGSRSTSIAALLFFSRKKIGSHGGKDMNNDFESIQIGAVLEVREQVFSERDLILGILWEGDAQLHTNVPGMGKTSFGTTIVHGNSVTSKIIGRLFRTHFKSVEEIIVSEIDVAYLGAVHVGDTIQGKFRIEDLASPAGQSKMLSMAFEVTKNGQELVSKGSMKVEAAGNQ